MEVHALDAKMALLYLQQILMSVINATLPVSNAHIVINNKFVVHVGPASNSIQIKNVWNVRKNVVVVRPQLNVRNAYFLTQRILMQQMDVLLVILLYARCVNILTRLNAMNVFQDTMFLTIGSV